MAPDWGSSLRGDAITYELLDPNMLSASRGWLEGVVNSGSSITYSTGLDCLYTARIELAGSDYDGTSAVRVWHEVPAWGYKEAVATLYPTSEDLRYEHGAWTGTVELASPVVCLHEDLWAEAGYAVAAGASAIEAIEDVMGRAGCVSSVSPNVRDALLPEPSVWTMGESLLDTVRELQSMCGARIGCDGMGAVATVPDIGGTPVFTIGPDMVVGAVTVSEAVSAAPGRVALRFSDGDGLELAAHADAPASSRASRAVRGRRVTVVEDVDALDPQTPERLQQAANERARELRAGSTVEFRGLYLPVREGEAVALDLPCAKGAYTVKTKETSLAPGMPCQWTLEEVV